MTESEVEQGPTQDRRINRYISTAERYLKEISYEFRGKYDPDMEVEVPETEDPYDKPGLLMVFVDGRNVLEDIGNKGPKWDHMDIAQYLDDEEAFEELRDISLYEDKGLAVLPHGKIVDSRYAFIQYTPDDKDIDDRYPGMRHDIGVQNSARDYVHACLTLSEESGKVTRFVDGEEDNKTGLEEIIEDLEENDETQDEDS